MIISMSHYCIKYRTDASQFRDYIIIWFIIGDVTLLPVYIIYQQLTKPYFMYVM